MIFLYNKIPLIDISYELKPGLKDFDFTLLKEKILVIMQDRMVLETMIAQGDELLIEAALNRVCNPKTTFKKEAEKFNLELKPVKKTGAVVKSAMTTEILFEHDTYYILKECDIMHWEVVMDYEKISKIATTLLIQRLSDKFKC